MNQQNQSDNAILQELGRRLSSLRLNQNLTQMDLARQSGLSRQTIQRAESGEPIQTLSLVKLLRVLNHLEGIHALLPEPVASPIQQLKSKSSVRQRASKKKPPTTPSKPWVWGEDK